jgi:hypothetical protein
MELSKVRERSFTALSVFVAVAECFPKAAKAFGDVDSNFRNALRAADTATSSKET